MFCRALARSFKTLSLVSSSSLSPLSSPHFSLLNHKPSSLQSLRPLSSSNGDGDGDGGSWSFPPEFDNVYSEEEGDLSGIVEESEVLIESKRADVKGAAEWLEESKGEIFEGVGKEMLPMVGRDDDDERRTADGYKPWSSGADEDGGEKKNVFGIGEEGIDEGLEGIEGGQEKSEQMMEMGRKERELLATLKALS